MKKYEIIIAGFGGQGILLVGQLLAYASSHEGFQVSWLPSYGPEMRGGTANCMVVISEDEIDSPLILKPNVLLAMNKPSLEKFEPQIRPGGLLIVNKNMVDRAVRREDLREIEVYADTVALENGSEKVSNMVMLGAFLGCTRLLSLEKMLKCLRESIPPHHYRLLENNEKALQSGYELGQC